jgi:hypothetical protein
LIAAGAAHLSGTVGQRLGTSELVLVFCVLAAVGLAIVGLGSSVATLVVGGALLTIAPIAGVQTVMLGRVAALVDEQDVGAATGAFTFIFITGATVGVAAAGGLGSMTGLDVAVALLVVLPVAGMVVALQTRAPAPELVRA